MINAKFETNFELDLDMVVIYICNPIVFFILLLSQNYNKIPNLKKHRFRNKHNILPARKLKLVKDPYYVDDNNITWIKRAFLHSIFHHPFKNYTFETIDSRKVFADVLPIGDIFEPMRNKQPTQVRK